ncbi:MAG: hypothetical protein ABI068_02705 [Ktedonobacterales bacterium]
MLEEICLQKPTLLLTLGQAVLPFLARLEPLRVWSGDRSLRGLDEHNTALLPSVQFNECPHSTTVVALNHPGFWPRNVITRRYESFQGAEAEHALLRAGVQCSGYTASMW